MCDEPRLQVCTYTGFLAVYIHRDAINNAVGNPALASSDATERHHTRPQLQASVWPCMHSSWYRNLL